MSEELQQQIHALEQRVKDLEEGIENQLQYVTDQLCNYFNKEAQRAIRQVWDTARSEGDAAVQRVRNDTDAITKEAATKAANMADATVVAQIVQQVKTVVPIKLQPKAYVAPAPINGGTF
jgi:TolA-binding protein